MTKKRVVFIGSGALSGYKKISNVKNVYILFVYIGIGFIFF